MVKDETHDRLTSTVSFWSSIGFYSLCSSSMLLVNKMVLARLPYASTLSLIQICAAVVFIQAGSYGNVLKDVDPLEKHKVGPYLFYVFLFALALLTNMKSLEVANVETVIVFRSLTPAAVAVLDPAFLGRELPSARSWLSLAIIGVGAVCYANFDAEFSNKGLAAYAWPSIYLTVIAVEMTYGKLIVHSVEMKSKIWGPTYYTNVLSAPLMLFLFVSSGEYGKLTTQYEAGALDVSASTLLLVAASCVVGTGISFAGWWCRSQTSATTYTLVGVMNKCLTILGNVMLWDKHATPAGIASLFLCLGGGFLYRQAPLRDPTAPKLLVARLGGAFGGFIGAVIAPLKALFAAEPVKVNDVDLLLTPLSDRMASAVYLNDAGEVESGNEPGTPRARSSSNA